MNEMIELSVYELTHIRNVLTAMQEGVPIEDIPEDVTDAVAMINAALKQRD